MRTTSAQHQQHVFHRPIHGAQEPRSFVYTRRSQGYTARGLLLRGCITRRCRHDFATPIGQVVPPPPLLLPPHIIHVAWIPSFGASPTRVGQAGFVAQHNQTRAAHKFPTAPSARTDVNLYTSTAALTNSIDKLNEEIVNNIIANFI